MKKPIYIIHTFKFESTEFQFNNVSFPFNKRIRMIQGDLDQYYHFNIEFTTKPNLFGIVIEIRFKALIGDKRYEAFQEAESSGVNINLLNPPTGTIKSFIDEHLPIWNNGAKDIFSLLRWHYNLSLFDYLTSSNYKWFLTDEKINEFNTVSIEPPRNVNSLNPDPQAFFNNVAKKGMQEPLHFNLFREAESNLTNNPKSALALMVIALESGVKNFLITKRPMLKNILLGEPNDNTNPPPLFILISQYLKEAEPKLEFNKGCLELLQNLIRERNVLVHTGEFTLNKVSLLKRKYLISDILYLLDSFIFFQRFRTEFYLSENRLVGEMETPIDPSEWLGEIGMGAIQTLRFDGK